MKDMFELVVFDIAGTTIRDEDYVASSFVEAFSQNGIFLTTAETTPLMGYGKREAIALMLERKGIFPTDQKVGTLYKAFSGNMTEFYARSPKVEQLPHTEEIFNYLKSRKIAVTLNSGFSRVVVDAIMERSGWLRKGLVDHVIASDEVTAGRPHPYMIKKLMHLSGVSDAAHVMKVGDTVVDIQEGRNAGCGMVVSVTTGAECSDVLKLHHPDCMISSLEELKSLI